MSRLLPVLALVFAGATGVAVAGASQQSLLAQYETEARKVDPGFAGFSADRGGAFFLAKHPGGRPDTPSCATCHTASPRQAGQTRAGKTIAPMVVSATPSRFSDAAKAEKWFARNCDTVLGRACTAQEKGDFISFMLSQ